MLDWLGKMVQLPAPFLTESGGEGGGVIQVRRAGPRWGLGPQWGGRCSGGVLVFLRETVQLKLTTLGLDSGSDLASPSVPRPCAQGGCHSAGAPAWPRRPWAAKALRTLCVCRASAPRRGCRFHGMSWPLSSLHMDRPETVGQDVHQGTWGTGTVTVGRMPRGVGRASAAEQTGARCCFTAEQEGGSVDPHPLRHQLSRRGAVMLSGKPRPDPV